MRVSLGIFWVALFGVTLLSGCVTTRFPKWNEGLPTEAKESREESQKLEREGEALFSRRKEFANLEAAILKWELAAQLRPSQALFVKLARTHYLCGERAFGLDVTLKKSVNHFTRGLGFAEQALEIAAPVVAAQMKQGIAFKKAVFATPKEAALILYWYAMNLDKWSHIQGLLTTLRYQGDVNAAFTQALLLENDVEAYTQVSDSSNESAR